MDLDAQGIEISSASRRRGVEKTEP